MAIQTNLMKENKENKMLEVISKTLEALNNRLEEQKETNKKIFERFKSLEIKLNKVTKKQK